MVELRSARKRRTGTEVIPSTPVNEPSRRVTRSSARKKEKEVVEQEPEEEAAKDGEERESTAVKTKILYEFGGPVGVFLTMVLLPIVIMVLAVSCDDESCLGEEEGVNIKQLIQKLVDLKNTKILSATGVIFIWMLFQAILYIILPGPTVQGTETRSGQRLTYKLNGHLSFWVTLLFMGHGWPDKKKNTLGAAPFIYAYDNFEALALVSIAFSFVFAFSLYLASFRLDDEHKLAIPGSTGTKVYDFFMGRELNPRLFHFFDLKFFCELRPGLLGWLMLNFGSLMKQIHTFGTASWPMIFIIFSQGLYVWDALYFEKAILTTMDITTDGFGFMLAFGDLAWVPFTYSLQARFLATRSIYIPPYCLILISIIKITGYIIFRGANSQKDLFRNDPKLAISMYGHTFLSTKRGTKLLTSGFWGLARKINYTGDWLMSLAWCLATGFRSPIPYFYCIYFFILLIHRAIRDDHACSLKYGADWTKYKKAVPYVFIPKVV